MPYAAIELLANPLYGTENFLLNSVSLIRSKWLCGLIYSLRTVCMSRQFLREIMNYTTANVMPEENGVSLETACGKGCRL